MTNVLTKPQNKSWLVILAGGLLFSLFGLWILFSPVQSLNTIIRLLGFLIMISGITEAILCLHKNSAFRGNLILLTEGVFDIALGFLIIAYPNIVFKIISLLVGAFLIYKGILNLYNAFKFKNSDTEKFWLKVGFGAMLIALAVILIWHPEIIGFTIGIWISLALLAYGILRIVLAIKIKNNNHL
jgi:uncharacterized membrane protein HdeD (DUF308 family)